MKQGASANDINHECTKQCKTRSCSYKNKLDSFTLPKIETDGASAEGAAGIPVLDIEDLAHMGKTMKVCPFYYSRNLVEQADIVFVPYNYLLDKSIREKALKDIDWKNSVVVFDEAHNLESFASDSVSFDISTKDLMGCVREIDLTINFIEKHNLQIPAELKQDNLRLFKAMLIALEDHINNMGDGQETTKEGSFLIHLLGRAANITYNNYQLITDQIIRMKEVVLQINGKGIPKGSPHLDHFAICLKRVFGYSSKAKCLANTSLYNVVRYDSTT